jgi:hypothetical protein
MEITSDEIYFAVFVVAAKIEGDAVVPSTNALHKHVSKVWAPVKKGDNLKSSDNNFEVDLGDAEAFTLFFGLYERDNGKLYDQLKESNELLNPDSFDWSANVEIPQSIPKDKSDWIKLLKSSWKVLKELFKHLRQDDRLGKIQIDSPTQNVEDSFGLLREYRLRGKKGKYDVTLQLELD